MLILTHNPTKNEAVKAFFFQASYCGERTWNLCMLRRKDKEGIYCNINNFKVDK